jgi:hypothetical protein
MMRRSPLLLAGIVALLPACGHKGNPLPPRRKTPPMPAGFRLAERGDAIELFARAPSASVDGVVYDTLALEFLYGTGEVDLEKAGTHLLVRCPAGEAVVKTIPLPAPGTLLRGAVRAIAAGQRGSRSLIKALVVQAPLEAPRELVAHVVEDGVALSWKGARPKEVEPPPLPARPGFPGASAPPTSLPTAGAPPVKGTVPPVVTAAAPGESAVTATGAGESAVATTGSAENAAKGEVVPASPPKRRNGFFVYRRSGDAVYGSPLAAEPLELRNYKDRTAPLRTRVCYVVRAVASPDPLIESAPSNEACVVMRDITPPAPPAGLAVLPRTGGLELIWSPSSEPDLAGYRVLRAVAGGEAVKLAELEPGKTSYLDTSAQPGVPYSYSVVAFDQTGNQSAPSEAVEAALP